MHKDHSNDIGKSSQMTLNNYNIDQESMYKFIVYVLSVIFCVFSSTKSLKRPINW